MVKTVVLAQHISFSLFLDGFWSLVISYSSLLFFDMGEE